MANADTYVRARIAQDTKTKATDALAAMGLTASAAINLLFVRIAAEGKLPFDVKVPNQATRDAIAELEQGKGLKSASVEGLMADLRADD